MPARYVVPRYHADGEPAWYHVLHGTVPGHQIDFIYQPAVPQGPLTRTHFAHVARLMKYIEPREKAAFAFAIGNLSRDDVQHEPGHGGIALLFSLRVEGVIDHASRAMPPYAHGLLAIDRALDAGTLLDAAKTFHRHFFPEGPSTATGSFYRAYVDLMRRKPQTAEAFLARYIAGFDQLPRPGPSQPGVDYIAPEGVARERITIVHPDDEAFTTIASVASTIGAMLYRSNVKWTTISNGGDFDIPGGTSIRFVPVSEAPREPKGLLLSLGDVPGDEAALAAKLFGARPPVIGAREGWRTIYDKPDSAQAAGAAAVPPSRPSTRPVALEPAVPTKGGSPASPGDARAPAIAAVPASKRRTDPVALARPIMASDPGTDVKLAVVAPRKSGRARWVLLGGLLAAAAIVLVVAMRESAPMPPVQSPPPTVDSQRLAITPTRKVDGTSAARPTASTVKLPDEPPTSGPSSRSTSTPPRASAPTGQATPPPPPVTDRTVPL